jgi:1,2-diacylglycerol 3-alpha-glucosyltransferase
MRIAIFTDTFLPEKNGVATSIATVARSLGASGHEVMIIAPSSAAGGEESFQAPGVRVLHLPAVPAPIYAEFRFVYGGWSRCKKEMRDFRPEIVHVHSLFSVGWFGRRISRLLRVPLVGTNHIYLTRDNTEFYRCISPNPFIAQTAGAIMLRYTYAFHASYDLCICPSASLLEGMKRMGYRKPLESVPNPLPGLRLPVLAPADAARRKRDLGLRGSVILNLGRISYEKSLDVLLRAAAVLCAEREDLSVLFLGDGPARLGLERLAAELGIADRVVFYGYVEHQELISSGIMSLGDVFATACATENQPLSVLEAMAVGLPVVGVAAAGLKDLLEGVGPMAKPGDPEDLAAHIRKVLEDAPYRERLRTQSLDAARHYAPDAVSEQLTRLYTRLAASRTA